ncbi:flavin-containing monooxygenase 5-like [Limanda limanda]|uniref:flavin-containing monooxygenase 5-like n=1 Tax=Limanda limanda TaxID=27771 RepID=UPI0029C8FBAA|nr:flavin-containing monooxygenase 5-like [Limanda limanda]
MLISLVVNTSKEMMCFSDFPMPENYPNYMLHSQLLQYLSLYAEHFHLLRYINFQVVRSATQRPDFSLSGQWDVVTMNRDVEEEMLVFDAVLVCSGLFTNLTFPLSGFPGYKTFTGRCFHSWEYKDAEALRGKRVVVVGMGNSGGDIAVDVSRSAEKGAWLGSWLQQTRHTGSQSSLHLLNKCLVCSPLQCRIIPPSCALLLDAASSFLPGSTNQPVPCHSSLLAPLREIIFIITYNFSFVSAVGSKT